MNQKIKKSLVIIVIILLVFVVGKIAWNKFKKSYAVEEVTEQKYFLLLHDNNIGIIDKKGNVIIEPQYFDIHIPNPAKPIFVCYYDYKEGTGSYRTKIINEKGTELFTKYNKIETISLVDIATTMPYEKNVLKFEQNGKYGLIDLKGMVLSKAIYDSIEGLSNKEGELLFSKNGKYGVVNTKGAEIIPADYDFISGDEYYTNEKKFGLSGYVLGIKKVDGYRYGYMSYNMKKLLEPEYNEILRIGGIGSEDTDKDIFLLAKKNGQYGLIKNKKVIIDFKYQAIDYTGVNNLFMLTRSTKSGVYNSEGKKILAIKYDSVDVHPTYIETKLGNETAYYNLLGNRIAKETIKEEEKHEEENEDNLQTNAKLIPKEQNGKWGFIDKNGNAVVDYQYDKVTDFNQYGFAGIKLEDKWGSINEEGQIVIDPIYLLNQNYEVDFIGKYYKIVYDYKTIFYSDDLN